MAEHYVFTNNYYETSIKIGLDGQAYSFRSLESALQGLKCPERLHEFTRLSATDAVSLGKIVDLRPDWDEIKPKIYEYLSYLKYQQNIGLKKKLLNLKEEDITNPVLKKVCQTYKDNFNFYVSPNINHLCADFCNKRTIQRLNNTGLDNIKPLPENKVIHSVAVAAFMMKNAEKWGVSPQEAYVVGMLHDIGYIGGRGNHEKNGALLLADLGVSNTYYKAIYYHGTDPFTITDPLTKEEKNMLLCLYEADMSIDKDGKNVGFKGRLEDIKLRYGETHIAYITASNEVRYVLLEQAERGIKNVVSKE